MVRSRLKVLLAEHDINQKDLAEKTGIQPNTISKICNNTIKQIPVEAIDIMCDFFNCEVGDIFQHVNK